MRERELQRENVQYNREERQTYMWRDCRKKQKKIEYMDRQKYRKHLKYKELERDVHTDRQSLSQASTHVCTKEG